MNFVNRNIMRHFMAFMLFVFLSVSIAGAHQPIEWSADAELVSESNGELTICADIKPGWKLYGIDLPEGGPLPTKIDVEIENGEKCGPLLTQGLLQDSYDPIYKQNLQWWNDKVYFIQPFKITGKNQLIKIKIRYITCDGETCLRPQYVNLVVTI